MGWLREPNPCQMKQNQKPCTKKKVIDRGEKSKTLTGDNTDQTGGWYPILGA